MVLTTTTTTTNSTRRRISTIYDHFALPSLEKGHHHHLRHRQKHKQQQQQNDDDMAIIERNNTFGLFSNIKNKNNNKETTTKKKKKKKFTVAVLGAAGGIGQTLSLLLKQSEMIKSLRLYDIAPITPGIAVDLSHINTESEVLGFAGPEQLQRALEGCDLVIIPAGIPRKPGMTRDDLFKINAGIVRDLTIGVAKHCPNAIVNIISNPVNSTVPIAVEVLKKYYVFDPRKVLGVTKLDVMRAETFIHGLRKNELTDSIANIKVPVIGGHAGATIIPLLSQVTPKLTKPFEGEELIALTTRIQNAGTEVVDAKAGAGSATLSMALAAENMATSCLKAMAGEKNIIECAYVSSNLIPELSFFASKVKLGVHGVDEILELGAMTKFEQKMVQDAIPELKASIDKGVDFARKSM